MHKCLSNFIHQIEDRLAIKKGFANTGFAKCEIHKFSGSILDYNLFKKIGKIEISPNCLSELIEINHLKSSILASSRDRHYEVEPLSKAWAILDKTYGQNLILEIG